ECESGEGTRAECMAYCEEANLSSELIECLTDLSCDAPESKFGACYEKHGPKHNETEKVTNACKTFCAGPCAGHVFNEEEREDCGLTCTSYYEKAEQECLANLDAEPCDDGFECWEF